MHQHIRVQFLRCPDLNKSKTMLKFNINYSKGSFRKTMKWYIDYFKKIPISHALKSLTNIINNV